VREGIAVNDQQRPAVGLFLASAHAPIGLSDLPAIKEQMEATGTSEERDSAPPTDQSSRSG